MMRGGPTSEACLDTSRSGVRRPRTSATDRHALLSRSTRVLLTAALCALVAAACGTGGPAAAQRSAPVSSPSAAALAAVQGATAGALSRTASISMTLSNGALFGSPASRVEATGSFDFVGLRGALSFATPSAGTGEPVIFTPTAVYVRPPATGSLLPAGKTWTVADFSDPESLTSNFPQLIAQAEIVNPAFTLSELLWGAASAAPAGREPVGGQDAARYAVTVDLNRAVAAATGPAQVPFGRALATESASLTRAGKPATITVSVWVSANGRLARVMASPPGAGAGTVTTTLSGFGVAVRAGPPPAAQVVDVLQLGPNGERENRNGGDSDGG
jgi:hypothetical protein